MSIYKTLSVILVSQKQKIMQIMHYYNYGRNIMTKLSNTFFLIVLFIFYCEQREVYYSDLANKEAPSSLVVFYERASTVTSCGVKCLNDNCCIRFIYNKMNKQSVGIHVLEKSGYSYQQVPPISPVAQQFVKGKIFLNRDDCILFFLLFGAVKYTECDLIFQITFQI